MQMLLPLRRILGSLVCAPVYSLLLCISDDIVYMKMSEGRTILSRLRGPCLRESSQCWIFVFGGKPEHTDEVVESKQGATEFCHEGQRNVPSLHEAT